MATAQARRLRCCPLHGVATDAGHGLARCNPRQTIKPRSATRPRHARWITSTASSRHQAECPLALRLHLCRDLDPLCLCRLCDRRLARRIVGWRVSRTPYAPALCSTRWSRRCIIEGRSLAAGSLTIAIGAANMSRYVSIKYTERLAEAGVEPSVSSVGDSYDNALAEPSIVSTRPRWSHRARHGETSEPLSLSLLNGSIGSKPMAPGSHRQHTAGRSRSRYYAMLEQPTMAA